MEPTRINEELAFGLPATAPANGVALRELRLARSLEQSDVAFEIGCSQKTVSKAERGVGEMSMATIRALATFYDVSPMDIADIKVGYPPIGSNIDRAKRIIIQGIFNGNIPYIPDYDVRSFVNNEWKDPEYYSLVSLSRSEEECLWYLLAQEGWVKLGPRNSAFVMRMKPDDLFSAPVTIEGMLARKLIHIVSGRVMFRDYHDLAPERFANYLQELPDLTDIYNKLSRMIDLAEEALTRNFPNEDFLMAILHCDLVICRGDRLMTQLVISSFDQFNFCVHSILAAKSTEKILQSDFDRFKNALVLLRRETLFALQRWGTLDQTQLRDAMLDWEILRPEIVLRTLQHAVFTSSQYELSSKLFQKPSIKGLFFSDSVSQSLRDFIYNSN